VFFGLGIWLGYNKSEERFGDMMVEGKVMYKSPDFGWTGHPDAWDEIKKQGGNLEWSDDERK